MADCYRFKGHFTADLARYRSSDEVASWEARDPLSHFAAHLEADGILSADELAALRERARLEIERSLERAKAAPAPSVRAAWDDVYA